MDSGPVVVDISSDDEPDGFTIDKPLEEWIDSFLNDKEEKDADDIVLLDACFNFDGNSGSLKRKSGASRDDSDDDCLVLEGDPDKPVAIGDDKRSGGDGSDDLLIIGQKGKVACRDFPHSRHLCANFPFNSTSHEKHCNLCHCYVCDSPAPCVFWGNGVSLTDHCHATDKIETWNTQRKYSKKIVSNLTPPIGPLAPRASEPICHRLLVRPLIQLDKTNYLNPCSTTIRNTPSYTTTPKHYKHPTIISNRRQNATNSQQVRPQREERSGSNLISSIMHSHHQFKRAGTPRSFASNGSQHPASNPNPMSRVASSPRSLCTPVNAQVSANTSAALSRNENGEWQDLIASVASELGVTDCISRNISLVTQPYTASSQLPTSDTLPIPQYQMGLHADLGPEMVPSSSSDLGSRWLNTMAGLSYPDGFEGGQPLLDAPLYGNGNVNENAVTVDVNMGNILGSVPGKEVGMSGVDPASLLYKLESSSWSSIANV